MNDFFEYYEKEGKEIVLPIEKSRKKSETIEQTCRFCKKTRGEVTFKDRAHTIPEFLGNKHLLSDDECDSCNSTFGEYESDLTNFLELKRFIYHKGAKKAKNFNSQRTFVAEPIAEISGALKISDHSSGNRHIKTLENGDSLIEVQTNSYIPFIVYKSLLKMALAIIDKKYIPDYEETYKMLMHEGLESPLRKCAKISKGTLPGKECKTHFVIFKKRGANVRLPTHLFIFGYKDSIFQLFIPFNKADEDLYNGQPFTPILYPHPLSQADLTPENQYQKSIDLSGIEKTSHTEKFTLKFDSELSHAMKSESPFQNFSDQELFPDKDHSQIILVPFKTE